MRRSLSLYGAAIPPPLRLPVVSSKRSTNPQFPGTGIGGTSPASSLWSLAAQPSQGSSHRFFETECIPADLCRNDAFRVEVSSKRDRLVLADILYIEPLTIKIARLDHIIIERP
jgi:hypothetical protein